MNELERLEAMLRARPASLSIEQRRAASDALGDLFPLAADVRVEQVEALGVPVVPWRGPGSLDHVLQQVARRGRAPRMAQR